MNNFNVIIVEDVMLELRGTVEIFRNEIPEANIIGTAQNEEEFWNLMAENTPESWRLNNCRYRHLSETERKANTNQGFDFYGRGLE